MNFWKEHSGNFSTSWLYWVSLLLYLQYVALLVGITIVITVCCHVLVPWGGVAFGWGLTILDGVNYGQEGGLSDLQALLFIPCLWVPVEHLLEIEAGWCIEIDMWPQYMSGISHLLNKRLLSVTVMGCPWNNQLSHSTLLSKRGSRHSREQSTL